MTFGISYLLKRSLFKTEIPDGFGKVLVSGGEKLFAGPQGWSYRVLQYHVEPSRFCPLPLFQPRLLPIFPIPQVFCTCDGNTDKKSRTQVQSMRVRVQ